MIKIFLIASLLLATTMSHGQITVIGPQCALPGVSYQYIINGPMDSSTTVQACVTGGTVGDSSSTCQSGTMVSYVIVIWEGSTSNANIAITSAAGNATYNVNVINSLQGGLIDSTTNNQSIGYDSLPSVINCSVASGGGCTVSYVYQWQQSIDNVAWVAIPGATGLNVSVGSVLTQTSYFRRMVTEMNSGAISYSDVAMVKV